MMKKYSVLFMVVALALFVGFSTGTANATWTTGPTNTKVLIGANAAQLKPVAASADVVYTLAANEALVVNDTITIDLTGGLKFEGTTAPALTVGPAGLETPGTVQLIAGGAAGDTSATWRVTAACIAGETLKLNSKTAAIFDCTGIADKANADMLLTLKAGGSTVIGTAHSLFKDQAAYLFTGQKAQTMALTAQTDTADVASTGGAYTQFTGGAVLGTATTESFTNNSAATLTLPAGTAVSPGKILYTLTGDFSGISKVTGTGLTGSDSAGSTTGGTAGQFLINAAKTAAYAVNTAAVVAAATLAPAPQFTLDGTTAQTARAFKCQVDVLADGTNWIAHTAQAATTLYTIQRNGVSFSANSIGPYNTIKITDTSGNVQSGAGAINITAYDAAGNKLTPVTGAKTWTVTSNATTSISGADLIANYAVTPMRYEFAVQTANATCTNVKKTPGGFSSTVFSTSGSAL